MAKTKQKNVADVTMVEIETPKNLPPRVKALREDLEARKQALEAKGWTFDLNPNSFGFITAEKHFKHLQQPTRFEGWKLSEIGKLLGHLENHQSDMESVGIGSFQDQGEAKLKSTVEDTEPKTLHKSEVLELNLGDLIPSSFEPQLLRRKKFTDEELSELATSIINQGLISPITVRPSKEEAFKYEVICGERRFLASKVAGRDSVLAVIRFDLTDEQALEIQFQENLQRKDIDPLDEAYSYQYLLDHSNLTVFDLSLKFGKPEKFINQRLKLNLLAPEVLEDVSSGHLPLGHALELSKLAPEVQQEALTFCYDTDWNGSKYVPNKSKSKSLSDFRSKIQREIFLSLKDAVFSTKATNLRDDGLPCVKCPQRTGAKESLFEDLHETKNDRCLNRVCFSGKSVRPR